MPAETRRDTDGTAWIVANKDSTIDINHVKVWWSRTKKKFEGKPVMEENLIVMQDSDGEDSDVIVLPLGMVYDLIDALNKAVIEA